MLIFDHKTLGLSGPTSIVCPTIKILISNITSNFIFNKKKASILATNSINKKQLQLF